MTSFDKNKQDEEEWERDKSEKINGEREGQRETGWEINCREREREIDRERERETERWKRERDR